MGSYVARFNVLAGDYHPLPGVIIFHNCYNMVISGHRMQMQANENPNRELEIYRSFFDLGSLIFVAVDSQGIVQKINGFGAECIGWKEEEIVGRNWFETFIPPHSVESCYSVFKECMETGSSKDFEGSVRLREGSEKIVGWRSAVIRDESQSQLFIISGRDITQDRIQEDSLQVSFKKIKEWNKELERIVLERTSELQVINTSLQSQIEESTHIQEQYLNVQRLYNAMAHNFPNGIIGVLNKEMKYVLVDGKELEFFGLNSRDLIGQRILHWQTQDRSFDADLQRAFDGEVASFDVQILFRTYNVTAVPLPDSQNQINEILVVIHNITDRKELEENLYRIIAKEKKLNELKSRFVTMALHEFRTPLSTILSSVFLLESYKGELYEDKKGIHINRIKRTVNILTEILNDFLRLGKLEEGKVEMKLTEINISDHAEDVLKAVYPLKKSDQKILYKHSGLNLNILLDKNLLRSILINILSNAIKYSHDDGEIVLETNLSQDQLVISVMDQGIGISMAEREHIFQRFFRGLNAVNIEGTGLGLHIVKGYVELMNGTIDFVSDERGTIFTVTIPLQLTQDETRLILH